MCRISNSGEDCGVWGTRTDTPDSLQNIKADSRRAGLDERCEIERGDIVINKRMASAFFETNLSSLFTFHRVDTVVVTGGSTSGCVRATVVDSLSRSYRTIVPEECVSDKHESPHFANLYDMAVKYCRRPAGRRGAGLHGAVPAGELNSFLPVLSGEVAPSCDEGVMGLTCVAHDLSVVGLPRHLPIRTGGKWAQLKIDGSISGLPRGRAGSGRSHFWNRPRPAEPLIRPSSITTSPRDRVITG